MIPRKMDLPDTLAKNKNDAKSDLKAGGEERDCSHSYSPRFYSQRAHLFVVMTTAVFY
jgi:hypothetical protein